MSGFLAERASRLAGLAGILIGWRPQDFWRATPAELTAVLGAMEPASDGAMSAKDLAALMEQFPDG